MTKNQLNGASLLSGIAIGAVVTMLAAVAVVPHGGSNGGSPNLVSAGLGVVGDANLGAADGLGEGESLAIDQATGETVVVDASGKVVRSASGAGGATAGSKSGGAAQVGGGAGGGAKGAGAGGDLKCAAGANGGATDTGVTATEIKLGATVAEGGIAESFLGEVRQGMEAVRNKVNRAGGVCGRQLRVIYKDDEWDPQRGAGFIQNLVEGERVFALAVSPSSEGLNQASQQGYFAKQGVPVVGADGLNATQFKDPFIWPVAAATTTAIDVMMQDAFNRGAQYPAIVFGNTYRFGVEGAFAFNEAYKKLYKRGDVPGYKNPLSGGAGACEGRFCGVSSTDTNTQYNTQVGALNNACNTAPKCDYLVLLMEPKGAQNWMAVPGAKQPIDFAYGIGGPQPLFTFDFGRTCGDKCAGMRLWTGYNPPIEQYRTSQAVSTYVSDLKAQSASADEFNQFTMGGYVGMQLLVAALKQTGPNLTRAGLATTLNSMAPLDTGLTSTPLQWTSTARYANHSTQAFEIQSKNGFTGWRFVQGPVRDPWLGQHAG